MIDAALMWAAAGWRVFPVVAGGKEPALAGGHLQATTDPDKIKAWWSIMPNANIGCYLAGSGLVAVDPDLYKPECAWSTFAQGLEIPATLTQRTPRGGVHYVFTAPAGEEFPDKLCPGVDIKRNGYVLLTPSVVDGKPYEIINSVAPAPVPTWVPRRAAVQAAPDRNLEAASIDDVRAALEVIPNDNGPDWDWWSKVAGAVHNASGGSDEAFAAFDQWSRQCPAYDEKTTAEKWRRLQSSPYNAVGMGSLFYLATQADPRWQRPSRIATAFAPIADVQPYDHAWTEDELAVRLVNALRGRGRFVAPWSQWLIFDGVRWREDSTLAMFDAARRICREITDKAKADAALTEAQRDKIITRLKQASTFAAVERITRSDRAVVATVDQWDADPWLLNTPGGVVDLRTGEIRAHRPDDHMTKITAVAPGGDCPLWKQFLHRVTDGNAELIAYLKRLTGYALTGSTREHVLPFAHGSGGNGKGVFIGAISKMMGDYHRATPIETFAASTTDRHPTELAMLRGARLVTAQETEEGRRWAESRIKSLTGGDRISARFMRQDFFEYDPQFTLLIAGNHKPGLRSVDEAIRRRFHLIPFVVTIAEAERDEQLPDRLRNEWPGILAWGIEGCLEWQRIGLAPPPAVTAATDAYLDGQDAVGAWLADCCDVDPNGWTITSDLYASFKTWAERAGEFVLPRARFTDALETRRFLPERRMTGRGTRGLRIKSPSVFAGAIR